MAEEVRRYGEVFNKIADEYDRHRPPYPDALIDRACEVAGLTPGASVLEIGSGTGKLTRGLLARGLRVVAVEPGDQLIVRARDQLEGEVQFVNARLEDAAVPAAQYQAVMSASAIQWVDPDVSWHKIANALVEGGSVALFSYFGLQDRRSDSDQQAVRGALASIAPELAAASPTDRTLDAMLEGAALRRGNVSEAWAWLGNYDVARSYAADLFEDVQLVAEPVLIEHTPSELNALLRTTSFWARLSPGQRAALCAENHALHERLERPIRSSLAAALMTARRVRHPA